MYTVQVKDHIMIAHSLPDPFFGPAQNMHGATYVIDVSFSSSSLTAQNVVIDIGFAHDALKKVVVKLNYQNLDDMDEFQDRLTTTEFLAHYIHGQIAKEVSSVFKGKIKVDLGESHIASASYEA